MLGGSQVTNMVRDFAHAKGSASLCIVPVFFFGSSSYTSNQS